MEKQKGRWLPLLVYICMDEITHGTYFHPQTHGPVWYHPKNVHKLGLRKMNLAENKLSCNQRTSRSNHRWFLVCLSGEYAIHPPPEARSRKELNPARLPGERLRESIGRCQDKRCRCYGGEMMLREREASLTYRVPRGVIWFEDSLASSLCSRWDFLVTQLSSHVYVIYCRMAKMDH